MIDDLKGTLRSYLGEERYLRTRSAFHDLLGSTREIFPKVGALPDFIIVGASKCGTTSLYQYLCEHPRIFPASDKEVHFFDLNYEKGESWYRRQFPARPALELNRAITGEATPYYLYHPLIPERIHKLVPQAKLIILLRNPVDRTISDYWHAVGRGHEELPLREALEAEASRTAEEIEKMRHRPSYTSFSHRWHSYKGRSRYIEQIKRYSRFFDSNQMLIVRSEDLFSLTQSTFDEVVTFLGLEQHNLSYLRAHNPGSYEHEGEADVRSNLEAYFAPYNEQLYTFLGLDQPWW